MNDKYNLEAAIRAGGEPISRHCCICAGTEVEHSGEGFHYLCLCAKCGTNTMRDTLPEALKDAAAEIESLRRELVESRRLLAQKVKETDGFHPTGLKRSDFEEEIRLMRKQLDAKEAENVEHQKTIRELDGRNVMLTQHVDESDMELDQARLLRDELRARLYKVIAHCGEMQDRESGPHMHPAAQRLVDDAMLILKICDPTIAAEQCIDAGAM
jgi:hypothetical protein